MHNKRPAAQIVAPLPGGIFTKNTENNHFSPSNSSKSPVFIYIRASRSQRWRESSLHNLSMQLFKARNTHGPPRLGFTQVHSFHARAAISPRSSLSLHAGSSIQSPMQSLNAVILYNNNTASMLLQQHPEPKDRRSSKLWF